MGDVALYHYNYVLWQRRIAALVCLSEYVRKSRKPKRFYIRSIFLKRREKGYYDNLIAEMRLGDTEQFFNFHRMSTKKFDELLILVGPLIQKNTILWADVISPSERLSVTLRYLASGDSMVSLSFAYRISRSSISKIVKETCNALWTVLNDVVFMQPTEENWLAVAQRFFHQWNFPHCVGAIDGKHVVMQAPNKAGTLYFNFKGAHSLVLLAACDADYCFTLVDIGASGRQSDGVFRHSAFGQAIIQEKLNLPLLKIIEGTRANVSPYLFVADAAFPMSNNIMRPFPLRHLTNEQRIYNYRLSRARRVIENSFGIMVARWRLLKRPIAGSLKSLESIIKAIVRLHNWLQKDDKDKPLRDRMYCPANFVDRETGDGDIREGAWRTHVEQDGAVRNLGRLGTNTYTRSAQETRDNLTHYFLNEGMVPWQWESVGLVHETNE